MKRYSLVKPTEKTPFHIDFNWWKENEHDWRVHLLDCLCKDHRNAFSDVDTDQLIDWIDPITAEVQRVDGLQHTLITHCAQREQFIMENTTMVEAIFRTFLANGNTSLTVLELAEILKRPPMTILRTISGLRVYKGIRPCPEC